MLKRCRLFVPLVLVITVCVAQLPLDTMKGDDVAPDVTNKKVILATDEFYGHPVAEWTHKLDAMQKVAFDGVTVNFFPDDDTSGMAHRWWGMVPYTKAMFQNDIDAIKAAEWGRYTDNYIWMSNSPHRTGATPFNWFSDDDAALLAANARLVAGIAGECGLKGIFLDTEQYGGGDYGAWRFPYSYHAYTAGDWKASKVQEDEPFSYEACAAKFRERGRQWAEALCEAYPEITILVLPGMHSSARGTILRFEETMEAAAASDHRLQAPFFDGILEGLAPEATIIDGCENGYSLMEYRDFVYQRDLVLRQSAALSAIPDLYRQRLQFGVGIWPDCDMVWHLDKPNRNHKNPAQFEHTLYNAMAAVDTTVWLWSNGVEFFPEDVSDGLAAYLDAFNKARRPRPLDWEAGPSFSGYDTPDVAHYLDFQDLDDLMMVVNTVEQLPIEGWRFAADPGNEGEARGYHRKDFDDSDWAPIRVDNFWERQGYPNLDDSGWYRIEYTLPDFPANKKVYLRFGAVDEAAWLYVDGELVAWHEKHPNVVWDKPFALEITGYVEPGKAHQLAIRAHDASRAGGIWKPISLLVTK